jgi:hypothetical protein
MLAGPGLPTFGEKDDPAIVLPAHDPDASCRLKVNKIVSNNEAKAEQVDAGKRHSAGASSASVGAIVTEDSKKCQRN